MRKSTKAVLLSALVFPGVGHVFLRLYSRGIVLAGVSFASLYYLVSTAVEQAMQITAKIQSGDVPLDVAAISDLVSRQSMGAVAQLQTVATVALTVCWVVGIVDSYRVGRTGDGRVTGQR